MGIVRIGGALDHLLFIGFGIVCIVLSVTKKEQLGKKAGFLRFAGVILILWRVALMLMRLPS